MYCERVDCADQRIIRASLLLLFRLVFFATVAIVACHLQSINAIAGQITRNLFKLIESNESTINSDCSDRCTDV